MLYERIAHAIFGFSIILSTLSIADGQTIDHVLHISIDGLHAGQLSSLMETEPESFSNFQRFVTEGATTFNARTDYFSTFTLPNHTSMLTGRPVLQPGDDPTLHHGYTNNFHPPTSVTLHQSNPDVDYIASTFDVAHDYGRSTALYATKSKFILYQQTYNATFDTPGGRDDVYLADGDQGRDKLDHYVYDGFNNSTPAIVETMRDDYANEPFDYAFLHFFEPDLFGHSFGWRSAEWNQAVASLDVQLGHVFEMIETSPDLRDRTAIVVTADHGGSLFGHGDTTKPNVYTIPFFVWGPGVPAGRDLYEINLLTRRNPGTEQIEYSADDQPIRNGDSGNLALALLGIPAIDGSSINARQDLRVELPVDVTWNGADPDAGQAGDGSSWNVAANWQRGERFDRQPIAGDILQLPAFDAQQLIQMQGTRQLHTVNALGDYRLTDGDLELVTGDIHVAAGRTLQVDGSVTTPRSIIKTGSGTLQIGTAILNSTVEASELLISEGRVTAENLVVMGSVANLGVLSLGADADVDVLSITDAYTELSIATLDIRLASGGRSDRIDIGATATYRGFLRLQAIDDEAIPTETGTVGRWQIAQSEFRFGRFRALDYAGRIHPWLENHATWQLAHFEDGQFGRVDYTNTDVELTLFQTVPGDVNGDGAFTTEDLVFVFIGGRYQNDIANDADWLTGDWNGDREFTSDDLVEVFQAGVYGQPSILERAQFVPEPSSGWLVVMAVFGCWITRRRRRDD